MRKVLVLIVGWGGPIALLPSYSLKGGPLNTVPWTHSTLDSPDPIFDWPTLSPERGDLLGRMRKVLVLIVGWGGPIALLPSYSLKGGPLNTVGEDETGICVIVGGGGTHKQKARLLEPGFL